VKGLGGSEEVETRKRDNGQALEDVAQEVVYGTNGEEVIKRMGRCREEVEERGKKKAGRKGGEVFLTF
jgi:hypothetical protein